MYSIKECFYTLQGEGARSGRAAVFLRFSGCNLWSGLESGRARAVCDFCDTDFVGVDGPGGGRFDTAQALARHVAAQWPRGVSGAPYVVCTGGEPLLQLDAAAIAALKAAGFEVAIETNGTIAAPAGVDWICVSPKADAALVQESGDELKLVYRQTLAPPSRFESLAFKNFFLQPMDGPDREKFTAEAVEYCRDNPQWRLSLQMHKLLQIP